MHALRHFYASVLLDAGENIKALTEPGPLGSRPDAPRVRTPHASSQKLTRKAVASVFGGTASTSSEDNGSL